MTFHTYNMIAMSSDNENEEASNFRWYLERRVMTEESNTEHVFAITKCNGDFSCFLKPSLLKSLP